MSKTVLPLSPGPKCPSALLGLGLGLTLAPVAARAQTYQWTGGGGADTNWSTAANWNPASAPASNADFLFSNNGGLLANPAVISLDAPRTVNSLTYDSTLAYTISGSSILTFGDTSAAGLPSITLNTGYGPQANHEINVPVTIAELLTITNNSTDNLTFNGTMINTGGIAVYGTGATSFDGASYTGGGGIQKYGSGTLFLRKTNQNSNASEDYIVHEGILSASGSQWPLFYNTTTAHTDPTVQILSGASLEIEYDGTVSAPTGGIANNYGGIDVSGNGVTYSIQGEVGAIYAAPGDLSSAGVNNSIRMVGDTAFGAYAGSTLNFPGGAVIDDGTADYDFIKVGQGKVYLSGGTSSWTGDTIVKEGLLAANSNSAATFPGGYTTPASNPNPGRLVLDGGVFGIDGSGATLTRSLGTGANQIYWAGDGGFAPSSSKMTVNLGGAGAMVT